MIIMAVVGGGAGLSYPVQGTLIDLAGLGALAIGVRRLDWRSLRCLHQLALAVLACAFGLVVAQLIPGSVTLDGGAALGETSNRLARAAGLAGRRTLSLTPDATWEALLTLVVPAGIFVGTLVMTDAQRWRAMRLIVFLGCVGALLGCLQYVAGTGSVLYPFQTAHQGYGLGWFVNRNHQAAFLCALIPLAAALSVGEREQASGGWRSLGALWTGASLVLLTLGTVATMSRAGLLLLPCAFAATLPSLSIQRAGARRAVKRAGARRALFVSGLLAVAAVGLGQTSLVQQTLDRFGGAPTDARWAYWSNTAYAFGKAGFGGTGFGSFEQVYPMVEPLDDVVSDVINDAHNDYLQVALEGGWPAIALLVAGGAVMAAALHHGLGERPGRSRVTTVLAATAGIGVLLAASVTDYPLRMASVAALIAFFAGLLFPTAPVVLSGDRRATGAASGGLLLGVMLMSVPIGQSGWGRHLLLTGRPLDAVRWMPWSSTAWTRLAVERQRAGDIDASADAARHALSISTLQPAAARVLGLALLVGGRADQADRLLSVAGLLGWRDVYLQAWLAQRAVERDQFTIAVQRADAILRQHQPPAEVLRTLVDLLSIPQARAALAIRLARNPQWRSEFFRQAAVQQGRRSGDIVALVGELRRDGSPLSADEAEALAEPMLTGRDVDGLRSLRLAVTDGIAPIDGDFTDVPVGVVARYGGAIAWMAPPLFGATVTASVPDDPVSGTAISIVSDGSAEGVVLSQTQVLSPGRYHLQLSARGAAAPGHLGFRMTCRSTAGGPASSVALAWQPARSGWLTATGDFAVAPGCSLSDAEVMLKGAEPTTIWLDRITFSRAG